MKFIHKLKFAFSKPPIQKYRETKKFDVDNFYSCDITEEIEVGDMNRGLGIMSLLSRGNFLIQKERIRHDK